MTEPLLEVRGLTVRSDEGRVLVDDLSLSVQPGARLALIGESGSGKSLTSLAIMGLLPDGMMATGSIRVAGHEMVGVPDAASRRVRGRRVGIVFQEPLTALDPLARLGDQLGEALARAAAGSRRLPRAARREAVRAALAEVRLREVDRITRSYPHEASGGQRQRVAIAMALAARPDLLILDEPTTALDVTVQAGVLRLLDGIVAGSGMSTLFVSHDLAVVAQMADEAVVLRGGRPVERGPVARLLASPQEEYTRRLVAAARALDDALDVGGPAGGAR
jgi:peptide/nickel transport system ATP-binding protein